MKKEVITLSDGAKEYISERCINGQYIKVTVVNKGCSGQKYSYDLVDIQTAGRFDEVISWESGGIIIDAASVMFLIGSKLDIRSNVLEKYLIWDNPQAINQCGCGESFSIKEDIK